MDAVTALSVAAAAVQFLTFTSEVISKGREIYLSADGTTVSHAEIQVISQHLKELCRPLRSIEGERMHPGAELDLKKLCKGCVKIQEELEKSIMKLKVQGNHLRKWKSLRQALKSVWAEPEIDQMIVRLNQFRSQIDTTLLFILRENISKLAEDQKTTSENVSQILLQSVVVDRDWQSQLISSVHQQRIDTKEKYAIEDFSADLTASTEVRRQHMVEAKILERLKFQNMYDRHERIPDAYPQTFQWVFNELPTTDSDEVFDNYVNWLRNAKNIYWITGKPGAGKSTLIKNLFRDKRTRAHANLWTPEKELILAGFFFWNSGTDLQMSKEGMLRSLLHEILEEHRDLISSSFQQSWINYELWGGDLVEWRWQELIVAFKAMIINSQHKFLIFIDGLDEFSGDHTELIDFILEVSKIQNLKLCVASRPWLLFEEAFGKLPRLRAETLTRADIELFVTEKFRASERFTDLQLHEPEEAKILINEVTGKAEGVFLWVTLVVQSLLDGLRDGDNMRDLRTRLLDLPSDLESLFQRILDRLDPHYFRQASMLFQLMETVIPRPLTVLNVLFAEEGLDRAMETDYKPLTGGQRASKAEGVRRKLNSRTKGLLEITPVKSEPDRAHVQYLHRTVKDYLGQEEIWQQVLRGTDDSFIPSLSLCGAYLLDLKTMEVGSWATESKDVGRLWDAVRGCVDHTHRAKVILAEKHVKFFDEIDKTNRELFKTYQKPDPNRRRTWDRISGWGYWTDTAVGSLESLEERRAWVLSSPCSSFLEYAIYRGFHQYLEVKISSGEVGVNDRIKGKALLYHAAVAGEMGMIRYLLEHGANPNLKAKDDDLHETPWQTFLRHLDREFRTNTKLWHDMSSLFVAHGADLNVLIYAPNDSGLWDSHAYAILRFALNWTGVGAERKTLQSVSAAQDESADTNVLDSGRKVKKRHLWRRRGKHRTPRP